MTSNAPLAEALARLVRASHLFQTLTSANGGGSHERLLANLARTELLILDDFALRPLTHEKRTDLLEIMEDRHGVRSTLVTDQLPVRMSPLCTELSSAIRYVSRGTDHGHARPC